VKAMKWQRIALAVFVVAFLALAGRSCIQRTKVFTTEPSTVIRNPDRFSNKTVILSGQVISALSIGGVGFYLLQDEKGSAITVATQRETPDVGAILRVKGRVRKALQIGAASVIGVEEWERKQIGFDEVKKPMKVLSIGQIRDEAIKYNGQPVLVQGKVVRVLTFWVQVTSSSLTAKKFSQSSHLQVRHELAHSSKFSAFTTDSPS